MIRGLASCKSGAGPEPATFGLRCHYRFSGPSRICGPDFLATLDQIASVRARRSRPRRTKKQSDPNRRTFADLALNGHPAPVGRGDAAADRQTQAGAPRADGARGIDPVEPLPEVRQVLRRDPFAGIRHRWAI